MKSLIPLRPDNYMSPLSQPEQAALTWYVLSGCSKKEAFITFARPDMLESKAKAAIDEYVKQFYSRKDVKEYIEAYQKTLDVFLHPEPVQTAPAASMEERKAKARNKAMEFAMGLAENIEQAEDPEFVMKLLDKVGILEGEDAEEVPRRYLPVTCGECAYRKFVEENCEEVEDGTEFAVKKE